MKKNIWFFLLLLLLSAIIGSAIGEIVGLFLPPGSFAFQFFTTAAAPSFGPAEFDLLLVKLHLGIAFHLNLTALLAMILATIYYLKTL